MRKITLMRNSLLQRVRGECIYSNTSSAITAAPHSAENISNDIKLPTSDLSSRSTIKTVKPFEEIPGPKPLPIIGNIWRYIPPFGDLDITKMHINARKMRERYGPLVREKVVADRIVLHVFDPRDIETVFRNEGRYPTRLSHRALLKYRLQKPEQYRNGGLFPSNGSDWAEMRTKFQIPLMRRKNMEVYREDLYKIAEDLIKVCDQLNLFDGNDDLTPMLDRWALEATGVLALDNRLGCLRLPIGASSSDYPQRLMEANAETHNITMITENGLPFWRYWDTPAYKKLVRAQDTMVMIVNEFLKKKTPLPSTEENATILQRFLSLSGDKRDVYTMIMDIFLAGNDTTAYSMAYLLYHLSKYPDKQQRLREELRSVQSKWGSLPPMQALDECAYLRACTRESHRLLPIALGTGRILETDVTLSGYNVPAGIMMLVHTQTSSRDPEQFPEPDEFLPERWLRSTGDSVRGTSKQVGQPNPVDTTEAAAAKRSHHPFAFLPFGYGPRMCIGRRFAEAMMNTLTFKIITEYSLEYTHDKPMDCFTRLINVPDQPLKVKWTKILPRI